MADEWLIAAGDARLKDRSENKSLSVTMSENTDKDAIEGGCRCGRIRYRIAASKLPNVYACHCLDCQTWSGSAFSLQFFVPEDHFEVTGEPALYERANGSRISRQFACPNCFTRVYNTNSVRPGFITMRGGSLDQSDALNIVAHIWTKRKMAGFVIPDNVPSWPEGAPPSDFAAILLRD